MKKKWTAHERALRIEIVRTRAALERQGLLREVRIVQDSLTLSNIVRAMLPQSAKKVRPLHMLKRGLALTRRYPLLLSGATALLSSMGKHSRWWGIGTGLLLGWRFLGALQKSQGNVDPARPQRR